MRDYQKEFENRVAFIRQVVAESHASGIVFGNSGGKDSALVGILCKAACDNTVGIIMPCASKRNFTLDTDDAKAVAEQFHIETRSLDLTGVRERLAEALSDIDNLIDNTEKLIEKKKAIKQGVMQELLTRKRRLPGFSGEWQETTLSDLCYLITKQTGFDYSATIKPSLTTSQEQNMYSFIQNKDFCGYDVNYDTDFYIPKDVAESFPRILLSEPCLLVSISGRIGNVAYFQNAHTAFAGGAVGIAKFKDTSLIEWCMLYLQSDAGQKQIFLNEKVGAQHNLTVADVRGLQIMLPDVEERLAIQNAIRDMDNDILLIEKKLQKYKYLKQGMMSKLLTGEIRLAE